VNVWGILWRFLALAASIAAVGIAITFVLFWLAGPA
jgi:hypothetical protein